MNNESMSKNEYMRRYFPKSTEELERERMANMTAYELGGYFAEKYLEQFRFMLEEYRHGS